MVHGIRGEEGQCPSTADAGATQDAVSRLALHEDPAEQQRRADQDTDQDLARRSYLPQLVGQEKGHPDHQNDNTDFVQPVRAESFFKVKTTLEPLEPVSYTHL